MKSASNNGRKYRGMKGWCPDADEIEACASIQSMVAAGILKEGVVENAQQSE